jgi:hypothetical protein
MTAALPVKAIRVSFETMRKRSIYLQEENALLRSMSEVD